MVAKSCQNLGINVLGYDPVSSVSGVEKYSNIGDMVSGCDFLSIHVPYIKGETDNLLNEENLSGLNSECHILNFARNGILDEDYLIDRMRSETFNGYYITDFPNNNFAGNPQVIQIPHLGASTNEASENSTLMAVNQLDEFLMNGTIKNSVNFPEVDLERNPDSCVRLSIINRNTPGVISEITKLLRKENINIVQQINKSSGDIAYNLFDLDCDKESESLQKINNRTETINHVIRTRIINLS
jgi:D-3-phosphoglycerate dehydrogenase